MIDISFVKRSSLSVLHTGKGQRLQSGGLSSIMFFYNKDLTADHDLAFGIQYFSIGDVIVAMIPLSKYINLVNMVDY